MLIRTESNSTFVIRHHLPPMYLAGVLPCIVVQHMYYNMIYFYKSII